MSVLGWILLLALVLGAILGSLMLRDPGYVLIVYDTFSLETSLWGALLALALLILAVRLLFGLFGNLFLARSRLQQWNRTRLQRRGRQQLRIGLQHFLERRWQAAEQALARSAKGSEQPAVSLLFAARAAQQRGDRSARDQFLQQAIEADVGTSASVPLVRAELMLQDGQSEQALASLLGMKASAGQHPLRLRLLAESQLAVGDYAAALQMVPALRKRQAMDEAALEQLVAAGLDGLRGISDPTQRAQALKLGWEALPKDLRRMPRLAAAYARGQLSLATRDAVQRAESTLRDAISRSLDNASGLAALLEVYTEVPYAGGPADYLKGLSGEQLKALEGWLKQQPNNAALLRAAGMICIARNDLDRARQLLESALRAEPTAPVYRALAELYQQLGEYQRSSQYYALAAGQPRARKES